MYRTCDLPVEDLVAYDEGALAGARKEKVEAHLRACPSCRDELASFASVDGVLRSATPLIDDPTGRALISARLRAEVGRRAPRGEYMPASATVAAPTGSAVTPAHRGGRALGRATRLAGLGAFVLAVAAIAVGLGAMLARMQPSGQQAVGGAPHDPAARAVDDAMRNFSRSRDIARRDLGVALDLSSATADGFTLAVKRVYATRDRVTIGYAIKGPDGRDVRYHLLAGTYERTGSSPLMTTPTMTDSAGNEYSQLPEGWGGGQPVEGWSAHVVEYGRTTGGTDSEDLTLRWNFDAIYASEQLQSGANREKHRPPCEEEPTEPGTECSFPVRGPFSFTFTAPVDGSVPETDEDFGIAEPTYVATAPSDTAAGNRLDPETAAALLSENEPKATLRGVRQAPDGLVVCGYRCDPKVGTSGGVVLYSEGRGAQGRASRYGFILAGRYEGQWTSTVGVGADGRNEPLPPGAPATTYNELIPSRDATNPDSEGMGDWMVVWGYAVSPRVAAVEVVLDAGRTLRDTLTGGMYAVIVEAGATCEVRALDSHGQVLLTIPGVDGPSPRSQGCK